MLRVQVVLLLRMVVQELGLSRTAVIVATVSSPYPVPTQVPSRVEDIILGGASICPEQTCCDASALVAPSLRIAHHRLFVPRYKTAIA